MRLVVCLSMFLFCLACGSEYQDSTLMNSESQETKNDVHEWKSLFVAADNSIDAFDNARKKLKDLLVDKQPNAFVSELSARKSENVTVTTKARIIDSTKNLAADENSACLVHITSHGYQIGIVIDSDDSPAVNTDEDGNQFVTPNTFLTPYDLNRALEKGCGKRPTILLVSACYSGVFTEYRRIKKPNVAILTASRYDRTSFGCSPEDEYTYWDGCLIEHLSSSKTVNELSENMLACVEKKEKVLFKEIEEWLDELKNKISYDDFKMKKFSNCSEIEFDDVERLKSMTVEDIYKPSLPQTFIGKKMDNFVLPTYSKDNKS